MKKVVLLLVVVFLGFWLFTDPAGLADTSTAVGEGAWSATTAVFSQVIDFLGEL